MFATNGRLSAGGYASSSLVCAAAGLAAGLGAAVSRGGSDFCVDAGAFVGGVVSFAVVAVFVAFVSAAVDCAAAGLRLVVVRRGARFTAVFSSVATPAVAAGEAVVVSAAAASTLAAAVLV
ncbi:MAG: hypothetical protein WC913_01175, partial [Desulfuromonas sp.]